MSAVVKAKHSGNSSEELTWRAVVTDVRMKQLREERRKEQQAVLSAWHFQALETGSSWVASRNPGEDSVVETSEQVRANGQAREEQQFPTVPNFVCVGSAELSQLGRGLPLASDESQGFWDILKYAGQPFHTLVPNVWK